MKKKRILSLSLAAAMLFGSAAMLPQNAFTEQTTIMASADSSEEDFEYGAFVESPYEPPVDDSVVISKYKGSATTLTIPATLGGKKVKRILNGSFSENNTIKDLIISEGIEDIDYFTFSNLENLESVTIPSSVKVISDSMFSGCTNLKSVTISEGVEKIADNVFENCTALERINIPDGVTYIGWAAFRGCTNLSEITIPGSVKEFRGDAFTDTKWLDEQRENSPLVVVNNILIDGKTCSGKVVIPNGVKEIGESAFCDYNESQITEVIIPEGVETIGKEAFRCCNMSSVKFPDTLKEIKGSAFSGCSNLTSITLPEGLEIIGDSAFSGSLNIESINIPSNAKIGNFSFMDTKWLYDQMAAKPLVIYNGTLLSAGCCKETELTIPSSVTHIAGGAFTFNDTTKSVIIPDSVKSIGSAAFDGCFSLESVSMPENIDELGSSVFFNCTNLKHVNLPNNITEIGSQMFTLCSIEQITIPEGVTVIRGSAFCDCKKLKSINIPDSVKQIEYGAFQGCDSLESVTIPKSVTYIGWQALGYIYDESIWDYAKKNNFKIYCYKNSAGADYAINYGFDYEYLSYFDYIALEDGTLEITQFVGETDELDIPSTIDGKTVTSISERAFSNGTFTKAVIPDTVTKIGDSAFSNCKNLMSITLPDSITDIGEWTFLDCESLISVILPAGLTGLGESVFYGCTALSSVTIPNTLETIGNMAFYNCDSLESITIPDSVRTIAPAAFMDCDALTSVTVPESVEKIDTNAFGLCDKLININVDNNNNNYSSVDGVLYNKDKTELIACPTARTEITFPESMNRIALCAMNGCKLRSVTIPETITKIEKQTFAGCPDLTEVVIPSSVTTIDEKAFNGCESLEEITIPDSLTDFGKQAFAGTKWLEDRQKDDPLVIVNGVLIDGTTYKSADLTIPDTVTRINHSAFTNCSEIKTVVIPGSVNEIGEAAFDSNKNITSVTLGTGIAKVGTGAFYGCESLKEITVPSSITEIGTMAFGYIFELGDFSKKPIEGFKIYCYKDTAGEKYAVDNQFEYSCLNVTITDKDGEFDPEAIKDPELIVISAPAGSEAVEYAKEHNIDFVEIETDDESNGFSGNVTNRVIANLVNNNKELSITDSQMTAVFNTQAVGEIMKNSGDKGVKFNYCVVEKTENAAQQTVIEEASRYGAKIVDLKLTNNDGESIIFASDKGDGKVTLTIPYKPTKEDAEIKVYYIDDNGEKIDMNASYDSVHECISFTTSHFSLYSIEDKHDHTFGDWELTTDPTCTAKGVETRVCSVCKKAETREVDALGHDYKETIVAPTCSAKGYTNHKCSRCEDEYNDTETEMIPHTFGDWKPTAFDVTNGTATQERTCSVCKTKETQTVNDAIVRFKGSGRYATAAAISQGAYPETADTVVLANGTKFADALAGATLANAYEAPILLTEAGRLPDETLAEIKRLGAKNVIILGGSASVGQAVKDKLAENDLDVKIVKGKTKYATAVEIAKATKTVTEKDPTEIFFVSADKFADALSVSAVAAKKNAPIIYLPKTGSLDADTAAYLKSVKGKIKNAYVIGGSGVIGADVMAAAGKALGLTVDKTIVRVKGKTKYDTCVEVNTKFADVLNGKAICVATGEDFPDALAGGVYAAKESAPLFLVNGKASTPVLSDGQKTYLKTKATEKIAVFGGSGVVPNSHIGEIAENSL